MLQFNLDGLRAVGNTVRATGALDNALQTIASHTDADGLAVLARTAFETPTQAAMREAYQLVDSASRGVAELRSVTAGSEIAIISQRLADVAEQLAPFSSARSRPGRVLVDVTRLADDTQVLKQQLDTFVNSRPAVIQDAEAMIGTAMRDLDMLKAFRRP